MLGTKFRRSLSIVSRTFFFAFFHYIEHRWNLSITLRGIKYVLNFSVKTYCTGYLCLKHCSAWETRGSRCAVMRVCVYASDFNYSSDVQKA
jgi:hypothetical protein